VISAGRLRRRSSGYLVGAVCAATIVTAAAFVAANAASAQQDPCETANALRAVRETKLARAEYVRVLRANPRSTCARRGLRLLNASPQPQSCARGDNAFDRGNLRTASAFYRSVGEDTECAKAGLAAVREVRRLCREGRANLKVGRDSAARTAFESALAKSPNAPCARDGIEDARPKLAARFFDWLPDAITSGLVFIGALVGLVFLVLLLAHLAPFYPLFVGIPVVGSLIRPRLSITTLDDSATDLKVGAALTARIKERLQWFREQAQQGGIPNFEIDLGTGGEETVELISSEGGLRSALTKAQGISEHTKIVAAFADLLYALLPIRVFAVSGVCEPLDPAGARVTLSFERNSRVKAAVSLSGPPLSEDPKGIDYVRLAQPSAVWIQYVVARVLADREVNQHLAESSALVREALDRQLRGLDQAARTAYYQAISLDPQNWSAYLNLAVLEVRLGGNFELAVSILEEALELMGTEP
jgi:tetratricopeptide (TPR) repeat protein